MLKLLMLACLCSALFVDGIKIKSRTFSSPLSEDKLTELMHSMEHTRAARQVPGPESIPEGEISMDHKHSNNYRAARQVPGPESMPAEGEISMDHKHSNDHRRTRQAPRSGSMPQGSMDVGPGNLGMQGLGNIPDPTVWIAKGQEVASQMARGRRQAPSQEPKSS